MLSRDLVYNESGHHDPQARMMVLTKDVQAILDGTKKAEPLFIRVNAGDCINFSLTNMAPNWTGGDAFQQLTQTNMAGGHVHLVKFDVTASDGGSNGWNYQQAAFTQEQMELNRKQAAGEATCTPERAVLRRREHRLPHRRPHELDAPDRLARACGARPSTSAGSPTTSCARCSPTTTTSPRWCRTTATSAP